MSSRKTPGRTTPPPAGQYYDERGRPLPELNRLTLSLPLERLRDVGRVLGVAHGTDKAMPLLGALRGGYLGRIVTNEVAARAILARACDPGHRPRRRGG